jgi:hypothetical protein
MWWRVVHIGIKRFVCATTCTLHDCLIPYEDMHVIMAVWLDIFEGVIALFHLEYFIRKYVGTKPPTF